MKKISNKSYTLYKEIEIPKEEELCIGHKLILENELKNKNLICLALGIILAILLTGFIARESHIIDNFLESLSFIGSSYISGVIIVSFLILFTKLIKKSSDYQLYEITHKHKERIYFLQTFSKWFAGILSVSIFNIFRFFRFIAFFNNQYRPQYIILGLLISGLPYILSNNFSILSTDIVTKFNIQSIELLILFLPSLLLTILAKGIVFSSIFSTMNYIDQITTMDEMKNRSQDVFEYWASNSTKINGDFSLIVKGASTGFISLGISKFFKFTLEQRSKSERFNQICIKAAKTIIKIRNLTAWCLLNYGNLLILILEIALALLGITHLRMFVLELIEIHNVIGNLDILNLSIYTEILYLFAVLSVSFLLSHSVFKAQLYGKKLRSALRMIDHKKIREIAILAKKDANSARNPLRRKIGLNR